MSERERAEQKAPCPHCGRTDYRWTHEFRIDATNTVEVRCDYCRPLRMDAYYFGFTETGVLAIDRILSAVAQAGKGYHHTDSWSDDGLEDMGEFHGGSYVAWIQNAANDAAKAMSALPVVGDEPEAWCSGCAARWMPDGRVIPGVVNLCGDCWRKVQTHLHADEQSPEPQILNWLSFMVTNAEDRRLMRAEVESLLATTAKLRTHLDECQKGRLIVAAEKSALQRQIATIRGELEFYAHPFGRTDEDGEPLRVPDFYDEMDFAARARKALASVAGDAPQVCQWREIGDLGSYSTPGCQQSQDNALPTRIVQRFRNCPYCETPTPLALVPAEGDR